MNRNYDDIKAFGKGLVKISGSFAPNGSSAVSSASVKGKGFSVARTSAGLFTVTLEDKYVALISGKCQLQLASAADQMAQLGAIDVTSAKTVQIRVWDISDGAVADVAANANNRIHFELTLSRSSLNS